LPAAAGNANKKYGKQNCLMNNAAEILPATDAVWREYRHKLRSFIVKHAGERDADDLLQEVFIKVHLNLKNLHEIAKLESWIFQITRNVLNDAYRRRKERLVKEGVEVPELDGGDETSDVALCLKPFLQKLPPKYRDAIAMTDLGGLALKDLAKRTGVGYSAVKSRVRRARQLLHGMLLACCAIESDKYGNIISSEPRGYCPCTMER
jgi:RNA polymerase sigma-70 factor, ECF subfamily